MESEFRHGEESRGRGILHFISHGEFLFQVTRFSCVKDCHQPCLSYMSEFFLWNSEGNEVT